MAIGNLSPKSLVGFRFGRVSVHFLVRLLETSSLQLYGEHISPVLPVVLFPWEFVRYHISVVRHDIRPLAIAICIFRIFYTLI